MMATRRRLPPVEFGNRRVEGPLNLSGSEAPRYVCAITEEGTLPRITLGAILVFVAIGSTMVAALLGAPDWLIIVVLTVLFVFALVLPTAIREFGRDQPTSVGRSGLGNPEGPRPTPTRRRRHAQSSDSSSGWFGFDGGWSGDGGSDSSGGSSGGGGD